MSGRVGWLVAAALTALAIAAFALNRRAPLPVRWTMINVNSSTQGDAHLLELEDGKVHFIDVGSATEAARVLDYLKKRRITTVECAWISHAHRDHYGGLIPLLEAGIRIKEVRFNLPDRKICDSEIPWGCQYAEVTALLKTLAHLGIAVMPLRQADHFQLTPNVSLRVLYAFDGVHTPVGNTDINDTSALLLLKAGPTRTLFSGDLNSRIGRYLAQQGNGLEAELLKVPHHGTDSVAPDEFFDRVAAKAALVPSPRDIWASDRSKRVRDYFRRVGVPTYVNGFQGNVEVLMDSQGYTIVSQFPR